MAERQVVPLATPAPIKTAAACLAKDDGVSLDQWIAPAVAQKVSKVETAAEFFRQRASGAQAEGLHAILALAPDPGDELPLGL